MRHTRVDEPAPLPLSSGQAVDLSNLLGMVSEQPRLGRPYCTEADYWATYIGPGLLADDARIVAALLEDVAGSPWLPDPIQQWARAWVETITELTGGLEPF
jgi:hypothetical protein